MFKRLPSFIRCLLSHQLFGGPIEYVEYNYQEILPAQQGFIVNTKLKADYLTNFNFLKIYQNCTGSGTDTKPFEALEKSISESLERWAFLETVNSDNKKQFGFDIDSSTNGMAAHPTRIIAQKNSFLEALERWTLSTWWNHGIKCDKECSSDSGVLHFTFSYKDQPQLKLFNMENASVIMTYKKEKNFYTYGFGAALTKEAAYQKAEIERTRNRDVLSWYLKNEQTFSDLHYTEESLVFYSTGEGFDLFRKKLTLDHYTKIRFDVLFSKQMPGPWEKWVYVYRTLLTSEANFNHSSNQKIYLFPF